MLTSPYSCLTVYKVNNTVISDDHTVTVKKNELFILHSPQGKLINKISHLYVIKMLPKSMQCFLYINSYYKAKTCLPIFWIWAIKQLFPTSKTWKVFLNIGGWGGNE